MSTVGKLREQSALCPAEERIVVVTKDRDLAAMLSNFRVVAVYPDTTDEHGNWSSTFKIELARSEP